MDTKELKGYLKACIDAYQTTYEIPKIIESVDEQLKDIDDELYKQEHRHLESKLISEETVEKEKEEIIEINKEKVKYKQAVLESMLSELNQRESYLTKTQEKNRNKIENFEYNLEHDPLFRSEFRNQLVINLKKDNGCPDFFKVHEYYCDLKEVRRFSFLKRNSSKIDKYTFFSNLLNIKKQDYYLVLEGEILFLYKTDNREYYFFDNKTKKKIYFDYTSLNEKYRKLLTVKCDIPLDYQTQFQYIWKKALEDTKSAIETGNETIELELKNHIHELNMKIEEKKLEIVKATSAVANCADDYLKEVAAKNKIVENEIKERNDAIVLLGSKKALMEIEKEGFEENLKTANETLEKLLSHELHEKYRDYNCVCALYDYIDTERYFQLTGPDGAYQRYEDDKRADAHEKEDRLFKEKVVESLSQISENQKVLAFAIAESEKRIEETIYKVGNNISNSVSSMKAAFQDNMDRTVSELGSRISELSSNQQSINQNLINANSLFKEYKDNSEATRYNTERIKKLVDFESSVKYVKGEFQGFEYTYPY